MAEPQRITQVPRLPKRDPAGHKGMYGNVFIVGGSAGMIGAVALAANAAFRGGAGLVKFAAPAPVQPFIATLCPCATSLPLACDENGELTAAAIRQAVDQAEQSDVVAVGPGFGRGKRQQDLIRAVLAAGKPIVIDADGLNNLAMIEEWPTMQTGPLVLTPHPGEFARLSGLSADEIQTHRRSVATESVQNWLQAGSGGHPLVLLLKGSGTVVTDGGRYFINSTGNPGMACGGTGDILTGLLAALIGQGLSAFDAAVLAADRHGRAGDLAARRLGQVSMMAWDLLDHLSEAMQEAVA